ncbi:hypothetical protein ABMY26_00730 (plasmid) [Azospirillum sp. HJ39]|uniref:hypothetical protein n=1 Tax=Azospirillum sp. HJ39 TaxID=3159496 RepID=UPI0035571866
MLNSGKKNELTDGEFQGLSEDTKWTPPTISAAERYRLVTSDIPALEAYLAPADRTWINGRVIALLSHYFVPDIPQQAQVAALGDWIMLLARYPQWAVQAAVVEWLDRPGRQKPMPGDIAAGCRWRVAEPALNLKLLWKLVDHHDRQLSAGDRP